MLQSAYSCVCDTTGTSLRGGLVGHTRDRVWVISQKIRRKIVEFSSVRCYRRRKEAHEYVDDFRRGTTCCHTCANRVKMTTTMDVYARGMTWRSDFRPCIEWRWHLGFPGDRRVQERDRTSMPRRGCLHGARQSEKLRDVHTDYTGMWLGGARSSRREPCRAIIHGSRCEQLQYEHSNESARGRAWESRRSYGP
ncbi:hypothetical protein H4582DRAFT_111515 [Lactarius indigo]|nr:hypothetical protein H4582DRAFT_111515 [Lactarius indigo]